MLQNSLGAWGGGGGGGGVGCTYAPAIQLHQIVRLSLSVVNRMKIKSQIRLTDTSRYQHYKVLNSFSPWKRVLPGIPRGSNLGPLLFNIFMNHFLFLQKCELENYADNSTMDPSDKNGTNIMTLLNHDFAILSNWFFKNFMVLNLDKSSFMLFSIKDEVQTDLASNNVRIKNSKEEKVLGITFGNKLDFSMHLTSITKKANIKLNALNREQKYMTPKERSFLTSSFIKSQFN